MAGEEVTVSYHPSHPQVNLELVKIFGHLCLFSSNARKYVHVKQATTLLRVLVREIDRLVYLGRAAVLGQIACNHNIAMEPSSEADAATNRVDKTSEHTCIAIRRFVLCLCIRYSPYIIESRFTHRPPA